MPTTSERVAFVTPSIPFPPQSGGQVTSLAVLEHAAATGPLDFFALDAPDSGSHKAGQMEMLRQICATVRIFPWHRRRSLVSLLGSYGARLPLSIYRNKCRALETDLREYCRHNPQAVLLSDHWLSAEAVLRCRQASQPCVLFAHNAEYVMWQRHAARHGLIQLVVDREAKRVRRYERQILRAFDRVVVQSELDASRMRSLAPELPADRVCCIRPAMDRLPGPPGFSATGPQLLFVATLDWPPNVQGLDEFLTGIWPAFHGRFPEARLAVVGGGLEERRRHRYASCPGVQLHGFVKDLDPMFAVSRAFVAPCVGGSGVKIKILEALSRGLPVLTTPDGAEGIDVPPDVLLTYSNPQEFIRHLESIWNRPASWQQHSTASRDRLLDKYSRSRARETWGQLIGQLAARHARRVADRPKPPERSAA